MKVGSPGIDVNARITNVDTAKANLEAGWELVG
jgi:hypothetical protein